MPFDAAPNEALSLAWYAQRKPVFTGGNQVRLLINGDDTFTAILQAIRGAQSLVIVQFFIIRDDRLGRLLQEALLERAAAGVRVYLLYDGVGSHDLPPAYIERLRVGGVHARTFRARQGWGRRFQLNFRNHRKIVVVDGTCAFVGGHNVGTEYLGEKPPLAPWRDTHVEVRGPAVVDLQLTFSEDWYWASQHLPELNLQLQQQAGSMHCQVIAGGPAEIDRYDRLRNINFEIELNQQPLGEVERQALALPSLKTLPPGVMRSTVGDAETALADATDAVTNFEPAADRSALTAAEEELATKQTEYNRAAGLNIMGRTTTPEFGVCGSTENPEVYTTRNPWDPAYTSGGSSSGSAVTVAAGLASFALGTDTAGSGRVPAALKRS